MNEVMGLGVIGSGEITMKATAPGIAASAKGKLVMAMDTNEALAKDIATTHNARWTTSADELLADPEVEAVYIAVPHFLHSSLTIKALAAGKHVLCEKPIATTLEDTDAMIAKAKETGLTLSVAFGAQYDDRMVLLKQMIADGLIGKVTGTRIVYRGDKALSYWSGGYTGRVKTDWRTKRETSGGGVLIMNAVHNINTLRYVTGLRPIRVSCEHDNYVTPVEVEDYIAVIIRYCNGAIGTIDAGSSIPGGDITQPHDRIHGTKGHIIFSNPMKVYLREPFGDIPAGEWTDLNLGPAGEGRATMIDKFIQSIWDGVEPPVTGLDGRNAVELILAAYKAGDTHQLVELA